MHYLFEVLVLSKLVLNFRLTDISHFILIHKANWLTMTIDMPYILTERLLLRKLPKLRTLSLKGNPVTKLKDFEGYVAAFLPKLMYYEFKMVDERMRKFHSEKNQGEIFKVLGKEQREEMKIQQSAQQEDTERMERAAFVNTLKGQDLLAMMFNVYVTKEDILLKLPQSKGKLTNILHIQYLSNLKICYDN